MLLLRGIKFTDSADTSKCTWKVTLREKRRMQKKTYALVTNVQQPARSLIMISSEQSAVNSWYSRFTAFFFPSKVHSTMKILNFGLGQESGKKIRHLLLFMMKGEGDFLIWELNLHLQCHGSAGTADSVLIYLIETQCSKPGGCGGTPGPHSLGHTSKITCSSKHRTSGDTDKLELISRRRIRKCSD